jgi:hypothetical protein
MTREFVILSNPFYLPFVTRQTKSKFQGYFGINSGHEEDRIMNNHSPNDALSPTSLLCAFAAFVLTLSAGFIFAQQSPLSVRQDARQALQFTQKLSKQSKGSALAKVSAKGKQGIE